MKPLLIIILSLSFLTGEGQTDTAKKCYNTIEVVITTMPPSTDYQLIERPCELKDSIGYMQLWQGGHFRDTVRMSDTGHIYHQKPKVRANYPRKSSLTKWDYDNNELYRSVKVSHRYFMYSYIAQPAGGMITHYGNGYFRDMDHSPTRGEIITAINQNIPGTKSESVIVMSLHEFKNKEEYNKFDPEKAFAK